MTTKYVLAPEPLTDMVDFLGRGGGEVVRRIHEHPNDVNTALLTSANVRSRDHRFAALGSYFSEIAASVTSRRSVGQRYVVVNATDPEPLSSTDQHVLANNPFGVIEGLLAAAHMIDATESFIVVPSDDDDLYSLVTSVIAAAEIQGWLERVSVKAIRVERTVHFSNDGAVLAAIEGNLIRPSRRNAQANGLFSGDTNSYDELAEAEMDNGSPRRDGLFSNPTIIETPETMINVGAIVANGPKWFRTMGTPMSAGNCVVNISGAVGNAGIFEVEFGATLVDIIQACANGFVDRSPRCIINGTSSAILTKSRLSVPLSWESFNSVGAQLGRCAFFVVGQEQSTTELLRDVALTMSTSACDQCPTCTFGTREIGAYLQRLGTPREGPHDIEAVALRLRSIRLGALCELPTRFDETVSSLLLSFPPMRESDVELAPPRLLDDWTSS